MPGNSADNAPSGLPCRAQVRTPRCVGAVLAQQHGPGASAREGAGAGQGGQYRRFVSFSPRGSGSPGCQLPFPERAGGRVAPVSSPGAGRMGSSASPANKREMFQHCQLLPWVLPSSSSSLFGHRLFGNTLQLESGSPAKAFDEISELQYLLQWIGFCVLLLHRRKKNQKGLNQPS